jgi:hypothetical protein
MIFRAAARLHLKDRMGYGIPFKDWDRLSKRVLGELLHVKLPKSARLGSSNWALQTKMLCHMFLLITSHCRKQQPDQSLKKHVNVNFQLQIAKAKVPHLSDALTTLHHQSTGA